MNPENTSEKTDHQSPVILLASPRGFCAGVDLAIGIVELAIKRYGSPVYVKHQIVHNPRVVADVERLGAITVDNVEDVPENSVVVFSAHGSPPSDFEKAQQRNLTVLDATCPLVTRVHNEAKKYSAEGKKILLVGHEGHQEVIGTTGQASMAVVDDREHLQLPDWDEDSEVAVLTQTTLSVRDTSGAIEAIRKRFRKAIIRNDICYATTNRQAAAIQLARSSDVVLVVGAKNSSNCNRLKEVSENDGVDAYLINGPEELDFSWLEGKERIGITSGASTPEKMVQAVIRAIEHREIRDIGQGESPITFKLPKELRATATEAGFEFRGSSLT